MSDNTPRLALPLISPGQAQKELFHNEALARIDTLLHARVEVVNLDVPPDTPAVGQCWVVGAGPQGEWTGHARALASWTEGGWRFVAAVAGMAVSCAEQELEARFDGAAWIVGDVVAERLMIDGQQVVGSRQPALSEPTGGAVVDAEARAAIGALIARLSGHGLIAS